MVIVQYGGVQYSKVAGSTVLESPLKKKRPQSFLFYYILFTQTHKTVLDRPPLKKKALGLFFYSCDLSLPKNF